MRLLLQQPLKGHICFCFLAYLDLTTVGGLLITLQKGGCHDAEVTSAVSTEVQAGDLKIPIRFNEAAI